MAQVISNLKREQNSKYQMFNPYEEEHLKAYFMLRYKVKQHKSLRFYLTDPHKDVVGMMETQIAARVLCDAEIAKKKNLVIK